eukprot:CCRYP_012042-RC/>CCRYP_012042-RC protein AED:0.67 eAED:0.46 QI:0/-1/0/1/-1/0/1/0/100
MDMQFHWLRDRECQEQFRIYWRPGKLNYADYWTKHHPAAHHQHIQRRPSSTHTAGIRHTTTRRGNATPQPTHQTRCISCLTATESSCKGVMIQVNPVSTQ